MPQSLVSRLVLPGLGIAAVVILWALVSQTVAPDLPSPVKTWSESRRYVLDPNRRHRPTARSLSEKRG